MLSVFVHVDFRCFYFFMIRSIELVEYGNAFFGVPIIARILLKLMVFSAELLRLFHVSRI